MKSSTKGRVVKSYDVEVSTTRRVGYNEGFQQLDHHLTVLTVSEEVQDPELFGWMETSSAETEAKEKATVILTQAEADAQGIRAQAEADARGIRAQAEADAQEILAQAQADLEGLRQEAKETAQAEVYPVAQAEGYRAGMQAGEEEGKHLSQNANQLFQLAQRAVQEEYAKVDEELLHLAIKIAERLVRSSLAIEPQRLLGIIQALSLLPHERIGWRLHVASDDVCWLEGNQLPCPWVVDESLSPGDCFLECQEGIFDARLEAQLDKLEHTLRKELLGHGGVDFINPNGGTD